MATLRQRKLAEAIVDNLAAKSPLNKQELVESVGYSHLTADRRATEVLDSQGVKDELVLMGFNEDTAKQVVGEILIAGDNDTVKLKAAEMIFKVHGSFAPEKHAILTKELEPDETIKSATKLLNDLHRGTS